MAEGNGSGDVRNGFVVLHRSIQDHPRYRRGHWFRVFADMEMEAAHRGYKREFDGKIIFVKPGQLITDRVSLGNKLGICPGTLEEIWAKMKADGDISWEARPGSKGRLFTIHGYVERQTKSSPHTLRTKLPRNPTANFIGESTPCPTANRQRTDSEPTAIIGAQQGDKVNKATREEAAATLGRGPLAPAVKDVLSSLLSNSSLPKRADGEREHAWREEARALYPETDVEAHILRIEEAARKRNVGNVRAYGLACLKKSPPTKRGEKPKRNGPRLNYEAALKASEAKADRENGPGKSAPHRATTRGTIGTLV